MPLLQSIWGGTFKDEKAGLLQKFTERGVVSGAPCFVLQFARVTRHTARRLPCAIQERIPTEASFSSRLGRRRSSTVSSHSRFALRALVTPSLMSFTRWRQLAGKHVVFGKVVSGFEVLEQMEAVGVPAGHDGEPTKTVLIFDCGLLP